MIGDVMLTDLAATPIAETLRTLSEDRKSGDLQVRSGKTVKTVFFDHGRIVFAASNLKKDRLGEALVALGRITDEEFTRASALMEAGKHRQRFGDALVKARLTPETEKLPVDATVIGIVDSVRVADRNIFDARTDR